MPVRTEIHEGLVPVKIYTGELEPAARAQLVNISKLPIVHHHVAAMPDVHLGIGATVGSVIPTKQAIIPAAVGVDIGCGMIARRLSLGANDLDEDRLRKVFNQISRDVPVGFESHNDREARTWAAKRFKPGLTRIMEKHPGIGKRVSKRPAILWGLLAALCAAVTLTLSRIWRKWPAYLLGAPVFLLVLFVFFENFARLLPANI